MSDFEGVPFIAIGNDELGDALGPSVTCPNCGEPHEVRVNRAEPPNNLTLESVACPASGASHLVGIGGREIRRA